MNSRDILLVSVLFTAELNCSIESDSWRGILTLGFIFMWSLILNLEVLKIKV